MTPLRLTEATMQNVIRMCRLQLPGETCGFIVAEREDPTLGNRVVWMKNVAPKPVSEYQMDDNAIRLAYGEFDQQGEEVVAVFHSHPTTEPFMSQTDLTMAADDSVAYLIISFANGNPAARAYRVEHFIGNTIASQVQIQVQRVIKEEVAGLPVGPWALIEGNYVRIGYQRQQKKPISTVVARVVGCDETQVVLDPDHKTAARSLPIDRIRSVHILREGRMAAGLRQQLRVYAGEAKGLLAGHDVVALPSLLEALNRAFPPGIAITMEEPKK